MEINKKNVEILEITPLSWKRNYIVVKIGENEYIGETYKPIGTEHIYIVELKKRDSVRSANWNYFPIVEEIINSKNSELQKI